MLEMHMRVRGTPGFSSVRMQTEVKHESHIRMHVFDFRPSIQTTVEENKRHSMLERWPMGIPPRDGIYVHIAARRQQQIYPAAMKASRPFSTAPSPTPCTDLPKSAQCPDDAGLFFKFGLRGSFLYSSVAMSTLAKELTP